MNIERPALQRGRCGQTNEEHPVLLLRGLSPDANASPRDRERRSNLGGTLRTTTLVSVVVPLQASAALGGP